MRIDVHAHFLARKCFDATDSAGRHYGPTIVINKNGEEEMVQGGISRGPIARQLWDPETRIKDMDATGVDLEAISVIPTVINYDKEADGAAWPE